MIRFHNARILLTKPDQSFELMEGELWVKGDAIAYMGEECVPGNKVWEREVDCQGNLLLPGFKNAHTHSAMTFLRSLADDMPLQDWLFQQVFPKEEQLGPEDVYWLTALANLEYLTSGITTKFDMYFFQEEVARACIDMGFRFVQTSGICDFGGSVEELEEKYLKFNDYHELSSYLLGFHGEYTSSKERLEQIAALVQKYKAPLYVHNSESLREVEECKGRYDLSPTRVLDEMGMYDYGGGGFHCVWLDEADIDIFAKNKLTVVTNPGSNAKLASGIAPVRRFLEKGINVAIGTDGPASNNCLDMFKEMSLVSSLTRLKEMDAAAIDGEQVLYMATAAGAKALGLWDCDSLAVGKRADLVMIDLQQPNMQPINNIVKNLVYSGSKQNVKMTMINGRILYEENQFFVNIEPVEIYARANEIVRRMK